MYIFRIYIRPKGGWADIRTTFNYCLSNGLLGVGWRIESQNNTKNWDEYIKEASKVHNDLRICQYIQKWVSEGDLVWTRDANGQYYLARVTSGWEYWISTQAIEQDIDMANIFRCDFQRVDVDAVPGKIAASFRGRRTIQAIADKKASEYSKHLWNTLSKEKAYAIDTAKYSDIFTFLDGEETEVLLFLYLQAIGWYVVPTSRKGDTISFEYIAINRWTGEKALPQVKTGDRVLNRDDYSHLPYKVVLFQSNECYTGTSTENVLCVSRDQLTQFLIKSITWLPKTFQTKMEIVNQ